MHLPYTSQGVFMSASSVYRGEFALRYEDQRRVDDKKTTGCSVLDAMRALQGHREASSMMVYGSAWSSDGQCSTTLPTSTTNAPRNELLFLLIRAQAVVAEEAQHGVKDTGRLIRGRTPAHC